MRIAADLLESLEARTARRGESKSRLAERYIAEGMVIEDHPGLMFRDGPAGRRPGLVAGPDVWQVIAVLNASPVRGKGAIRHTAEWLNLTDGQVQVAFGYYVAHPEAIDHWIRRNDEEAEAAEAAWLREQAALA